MPRAKLRTKQPLIQTASNIKQKLIPGHNNSASVNYRILGDIHDIEFRSLSTPYTTQHGHISCTCVNTQFMVVSISTFPVLWITCSLSYAYLTNE